MMTIYQILFIILAIIIAQWSSFFLIDIFLSACTFRDRKDFFYKNSVISLVISIIIIVVWLISMVIS